VDAALTNPPQDAILAQGYCEECPVIWHHRDYDPPRLGDIFESLRTLCALL
jgi:hypothetical protein